MVTGTQVSWLLCLQDADVSGIPERSAKWHSAKMIPLLYAEKREDGLLGRLLFLLFFRISYILKMKKQKRTNPDCTGPYPYPGQLRIFDILKKILHIRNVTVQKKINRYPDAERKERGAAGILINFPHGIKK